jgi:hypothetical protein
MYSKREHCPQLMFLQFILQLAHRYPRLNYTEPVFCIHLQYLVHSGKIENNTSLPGNRTSVEVQSRTIGSYRRPRLVGISHNFLDLLGSLRERNQIGPAGLNKTLITRIGNQGCLIIKNRLFS